MTKAATADNGRDVTLVKHSLVVAGHRTSISLEGAFWHALRCEASRRGISIAAYVSEVDATRGSANLSSALRVHLFRAKSQITPGGS